MPSVMQETPPETLPRRASSLLVNKQQHCWALTPKSNAICVCAITRRSSIFIWDWDWCCADQQRSLSTCAGTNRQALHEGPLARIRNVSSGRQEETTATARVTLVPSSPLGPRPLPRPTLAAQTLCRTASLPLNKHLHASSCVRLAFYTLNRTRNLHLRALTRWPAPRHCSRREREVLETRSWHLLGTPPLPPHEHCLSPQGSAQRAERCVPRGDTRGLNLNSRLISTSLRVSEGANAHSLSLTSDGVSLLFKTAHSRSPADQSKHHSKSLLFISSATARTPTADMSGMCPALGTDS